MDGTSAPSVTPIAAKTSAVALATLTVKTKTIIAGAPSATPQGLPESWPACRIQKGCAGPSTGLPASPEGSGVHTLPDAEQRAVCVPQADRETQLHRCTSFFLRGLFCTQFRDSAFCSTCKGMCSNRCDVLQDFRIERFKKQEFVQMSQEKYCIGSARTCSCILQALLNSNLVCCTWGQSSLWGVPALRLRALSPPEGARAAHGQLEAPPCASSASAHSALLGPPSSPAEEAGSPALCAGWLAAACPCSEGQGSAESRPRVSSCT